MTVSTFPGTDALAAQLRELALEFPPAIHDRQLADVERVAFELSLAFSPGASLVDLGGGVGMFSLAASELGMRVTLVDDFADPVNDTYHPDTLGLHARHGVTVVASDVRTWSASVPDASIDVITCYESMEHWHHSPRAVMVDAYRVLRPGGRIVISGPNAVNLRKRLSVPMGQSNWSRFEDWFDHDEFRGHVREPVLADLVRVLEATGFTLDGTWGRNWAGYLKAGSRIPAGLLHAVDRALQRRPTLCAALYARGVKPA